MALIHCKECGFKISDKATACIHCGAPIAVAAPAGSAPPKKTKPLHRWTVLLIACAVLVFGWMNGLGEEFENLIPLPLQKAQTAAPAPATAPATSAILVSATHLSKDYKANATSADLNYKGESLLVNGVIDSVNKIPADAPYVAISSGAASKAVHAQFPKVALNKLSTLKRGQSITVACTGGGMLTGAPVLRGCTLFRS